MIDYFVVKFTYLQYINVKVFYYLFFCGIFQLSSVENFTTKYFNNREGDKEMKKNRGIKLGIIIAILVLVLGVAYAAISANFTVSGTTNINGDSSNFNSYVIFDSVSASSGATATLSTDKKTITFTTQEMTTVGTSATLTYKIKNTSNYGASVTKLTCTSSDGDFATYLSATPSRSSNLTVAKNSTSNSETLTVSMIKSYPDTTAKSITYTCTMTATAQDA